MSSPSQNYPLDGSNTAVSTSFTKELGNPDARWEKTTTLNVGFDASLFTGGLVMAVDYFSKKTNDLLVRNQAPQTEAAVNQPFVNVGDIQNRGIDINITKRGKIMGEVDYDISVNFTKYKNKVLKIMDDPAVTLTGGGTRMGNANVTKVGHEMASFYGYKLDGFINSDAELTEYIASLNGSASNTWLNPRVGGWKLKDVSGADGVPDGKINDFDRVILGTPHPDFQMGFNFSLGWKGLDFSTFIFWNQGGELFNQSRYNVDFNTYSFNRSTRMLNESWTPANHNAKLPELNINDATSAKYVTDYFLEDATYLRVKTLQLGYTLPEKIVNAIKMDRVRIYVQAQNLITWSNTTALDPGLSLSSGAATNDLSMGVVNNYNPTPKQILFGINVGF